MDRKRVLTVIGGICLIFVLAALPFTAACAPEEVTPPPKLVEVLIGCAGVGGTTYALAAGMMGIFNEKVPGVRATAISTGGSAANIRMVDSGEMLMGLASASLSSQAYKGTGKFDRPHKVNLFSSAYLTSCYFMTLDPKIKTLYDLRGKRVALGEQGAATPLIGKALLEGLGIGEPADYQPVWLGEREANEALIDGRADVMFQTGSPGKSTIVEITTIRDVYFIPFPEEEMDAMHASMVEVESGAVRTVIPKGLWRGLDEDYPSFSVACVVIISPEADEDLVYELVKAQWENVDILGKIHAVGKAYDIQHVKLDFGLPLHPGALRYYIEAEVLTEDPFKG